MYSNNRKFKNSEWFPFSNNKQNCHLKLGSKVNEITSITTGTRKEKVSYKHKQIAFLNQM